jgi:hypothetical protein
MRVDDPACFFWRQRFHGVLLVRLALIHDVVEAVERFWGKARGGFSVLVRVNNQDGHF